MRTPHNDQLLTADISGAEPAQQPPTSGVGDARPPRPVKRGSADAASERRCILTGAHGDRSALIRLGLSPDGQLVPDIMARAPGRGAWIGVNHAALDQAIAKGKLKGAVARAHKGAPVHIAPDLPDQIAQAFQRHFLALLGLAAKSGVLLSGAEKIDQAARSGGVALLAHAADAADDGRRKRDQSWRVGEEREGTGMAGIILPVDRTTLSVALGRDNVVHIAVTDARWGERFETLLGRWHHFAGSATGSASDSGAHAHLPDESPAEHSSATPTTTSRHGQDDIAVCKD